MNKKSTNQGRITRKKIYDFIKVYIDKNHYAPTYREISNGVGIKSINTVSTHMHRLKEMGCISFVDTQPRTIKILGELVE